MPSKKYIIRLHTLSIILVPSTAYHTISKDAFLFSKEEIHKFISLLLLFIIIVIIIIIIIVIVIIMIYERESA